MSTLLLLLQLAVDHSDLEATDLREEDRVDLVFTN